MMFLVMVCIATFPGCSRKEPTPVEVLTSYQELRSQLDEDALGESIQKLTAFRDAYAKYQISTTVTGDISRLREQVKGRLHTARELAREGKLERAEKIIKDLANHFADMDEGQMARQFMQFDFFMLKANRLMQERRLDEAEQTIKGLLKKELTTEQVFLAERVLDGISQAKLSQAMSTVAQLQNAARNLQVVLHMHFAEQGKYPPTLSMENLGSIEPSVQNRIRESLAAIEDYRVSDTGFSLLAVGKDGKSRFRVTQDAIRKVE